MIRGEDALKRFEKGGLLRTIRLGQMTVADFSMHDQLKHEYSCNGAEKRKGKVQ